MSSATLPPPPSDASTACEKCGEPGDASACPQCGWYASLGVFVEVDPRYESLVRRAPAPQPAAAGAEPAPAAPAAAKQLSLSDYAAIFRGAAPRWAYSIVATTLATLGVCGVGRVVAERDPGLHTTIGVGVLLSGVVVAVVTHLVTFVLTSADDSDMGLFDVLVKPLAPWKRIAAELPHRLTLFNAANAGLTATLGAALLIGGIPYHRLLDWNIKAPPKQNLVGAIVQRAKAIEGEKKPLDEAVQDFAGAANADQLSAADAKQSDKPRERIDCVVIGYLADGARHITELLLAADRGGGRLDYLGAVQPNLSPDEERDLLAGLERAASERPLVKTNATAQWVQPRFTCRVSFTKWGEGARARGVEWDSLLSELRLPW